VQIVLSVTTNEEEYNLVFNTLGVATAIFVKEDKETQLKEEELHDCSIAQPMVRISLTSIGKGVSLEYRNFPRSDARAFQVHKSSHRNITEYRDQKTGSKSTLGDIIMNQYVCLKIYASSIQLLH
jgi:hypothetical protein